jgi:4-amino-4-deoxy-L-arabinose transferase-like glycosyltransferase
MLVRTLLLAAALRVSWMLFCPNQPYSDQREYHAGAAGIAAGIGYVDQAGALSNYYPVGYPAMIAPLYWALGPRPSSAFPINLVLGLLTIAAIYELGAQWFGPRVALAAALAAALSPSFVLYTTCLASENAYIPALLWTVLLGMRAAKAQRPLLVCVATGAVLAIGVYARATMALIVPVLLLILWLHGCGPRAVLSRAAVIALTAAVLLAPWGLRNQRLFGKFTPLSMNGGVNLWMGNHPGGDGAWTPVPEAIMNQPIQERDHQLMQLGKSFVRDHPWHYLKLCFLRTFDTLKSDTSAVRWNVRGLETHMREPWLFRLRLGTSLLHYVLLAFALARCVQLLRHRRYSRADAIIAAMLCAVAAPFIFIVSGDRYHLPMSPFLLLWAAAVWFERRPAPQSAAAVDPPRTVAPAS